MERVSLSSSAGTYTNLDNNRIVYALGGNDNIITGWGKKM